MRSKDFLVEVVREIQDVDLVDIIRNLVRGVPLSHSHLGPMRGTKPGYKGTRSESEAGLCVADNCLAKVSVRVTR